MAENQAGSPAPDSLEQARLYALRALSRAQQFVKLRAEEQDLMGIVQPLQALCDLLKSEQIHQPPMPAVAALSVVREHLPSVVDGPKSVEPKAMDVADSIDTEPVLSPTTASLIQLRDWILVEMSKPEPTGSRTLVSWYDHLAQTLNLDQVVAFEDSGLFNYERQQCVAVEPTADPAQHNMISKSVRPGYMRGSQLVRPQEVAIFNTENPLSGDDREATKCGEITPSASL